MSEEHLPSSLRVGVEAPGPQPRPRAGARHRGGRHGGGRWVGRGDKNGADGAAVEAMRTLISTVSMNGVVVIGEGEKDEAPMLYNGERGRRRHRPRARRRGRPHRRHHADAPRASATPSRSWPSPTAAACTTPSAVFYMDKLVTGPEAADVVDIRLPVAENIRRVAKAKNSRPPTTSPSCMLDRPRHEQLAAEVRAAGRPAAVHLRRRRRRRHHGGPATTPASTCCSASAAPPRASSPPARSSASAASSRAGSGPEDDEERQRAIDAGHDLDRVLSTDDLVRGENCFFVATGITDGELLQGRPLPRRRGDDPLAGDALQERHHPADREPSPASASCAPTARSTPASPRERRSERGAHARPRRGAHRRRSAAPTAPSPSTPAAARPTSPSAWPGWGTRCPCARASAPTTGAR